MRYRSILPALLILSSLRADLAWLDFQPFETGAAPLHRAVTAISDTPFSAGGLTFTLGGSTLGSRDRSLADPLLTDFVFADGENAHIILRLDGLPAGSYTVESLHYDGGGFNGALRIESRPSSDPGASTLVVANHPFATTPASFTFTTDGSTHELVFRENDTNNRVRLNSLKIRPSGALAGPPGSFVDIDSSNSAAAAGSPDPFWTDDANAPGFTSGPLWRRRTGFGFNATGHREIFEKDANGGVGDAATLLTTVTGLTPGATYGIHIAFLSVPSQNWQVRGGFSTGSMQLFTPVSPPGRITDLGLSAENGSNRNQYLGFVGNAVADDHGTLRLYADDGDGTVTSWVDRSWLEGFLVGDPVVEPELPGNAVEIAPDGAWTWFNDERAILHQGSLFAGYVQSNGAYGITRCDLATGEKFHTVFSTAASQQKDDHNNPSITPLPDGRLLLLYSKHNATRQLFQRTSLVPLPSSLADWGPEIVIATPSNHTYANTYRLSAESDTLYNFSRCINFNPSLSLSTDLGATWQPMRQFLGTGSGGTRPYPRYTSNGVDRIDLIYTDGHPRDVNNSVYHLYYRNGGLYRTDSSLIDTLANIPLDHDGGERGSVVYPFSTAAWGPGQGPDDWIPNARGWTWDVHYGQDGHPVCVFQAQTGTDATWSSSRIYYYYARWTGTEWRRRFIAQAGRGIYAAESDYGGGMCLDPEDPRIVYLSSNAADPFDLSGIDNVPLRANARYEIYRGFTADGGATFTWTPVTQDSTADNLRPIVPLNHGRSECLLWFHGAYASYTSYSTRVLARLGHPQSSFAEWSAAAGLPAVTPLDSDGDGLDNLLEFALSGDPSNPSDRPSLVWQNGSLAFPWPGDRRGIEWIVESSATLTDWTAIATLRPGDLPHEISPGFQLTTIPSSIRQALLTPTTPPATPTFFRLRILQTP